MTNSTKGASIAKTWQTPVLVSLDSGLNEVLGTTNQPPFDGVGSSDTSGVV